MPPINPQKPVPRPNSFQVALVKKQPLGWQVLWQLGSAADSRGEPVVPGELLGSELGAQLETAYSQPGSQHSKLQVQGQNSLSVYFVDPQLAVLSELGAQEIGFLRTLASFPEKNLNPVLLVSPSFEVHYANQAAKDLLPKWRSEVINSGLVPVLSKVAATGASEKVELALGSEVYALSIVPAVEPGLVQLYGENITTKKLIETELIQEKELAQHYLDIAGVLLLVIDPQGTVQMINQRGAEILGYPKEQILGKNWFDRFLPDQTKESTRQRSQLFFAGQGESTNTIEAPVLTASGEERMILWHGRELRNGQGKIYGFLSSGEDITEKTRFLEELKTSEARLDEAQSVSLMGNWHSDLQNDRHYWSNQTYHILGLPPKSVLPHPNLIWRQVAGEDRDRLQEALQATAQGKPSDLTVTLVDYGGQAKLVRIISRAHKYAKGTPVSLYGTLQDVTHQAQSQDQIALLAQVFKSAKEAVVFTDDQNRIIRVNGAYEAITGYSLSEIEGKDPHFLASGQHDRAFYEAMWEALRKEGKWEGEIWDRRKNGEVFPKLLSISTFVNEITGKVNYVGIFSDITQKKLAEEQLQNLAYYDALTGLPNRPHLLERMEVALGQVDRQDGLLALLFLDLDNFKNINDSLGHSVGDQLLVQVASGLKAAVRSTDLVARLGGDEFVVVLIDVKSPENAERLAVQIQSKLSQEFVLADHKVYTNASIGIAFYPQDGTTCEELLKKGDTAMYHSKAKGRGRFSYYDQQMEEAVAQKQFLTNSLHRALTNKELTLAYQPQVDALSGEILGMEALVRWHHPQRGFISPAEFIPIAEENGLILLLGEWVLREACRQTRAWQDQGLKPVVVSVNASVRQFQAGQFPEMVAQVLEETGLAPKYLKIEITESLLMHELEEAIHILGTLKKQGINSSIDDFGTGYSSLSYLNRLPLAELKIDRAFVNHIEEDSNIAKAVVGLAQGMGLKVIAEGAEDWGQVQKLIELGCFRVQGYFFSKPLNPEAFAAQLKVGVIHPPNFVVTPRKETSVPEIPQD